MGDFSWQKVVYLSYPLVSFAGVLVGVLLGVLISLSISSFALWLEKMFDLQLFTVYFIHYLPSELKWLDVIVVSLIAFFMGVLATIYPASRAAKTEPADALRHN